MKFWAWPQLRLRGRARTATGHLGNVAAQVIAAAAAAINLDLVLEEASQVAENA